MDQAPKGLNYRIGANINLWAEALSNVEPELSESLNESREVGFKGLAELNLPRTERVVLPVEEFLVYPDKFSEILGSERFAVNLVPQVEGLIRHVKPGLTTEETVDFIYEKIEGHLSEYNVSLLPYWLTLYGGSLLIRPNGEVNLEFREGDPGPIAYGNEVPQFAMWRDQFLGTFKYSFDEPEVRDRAQRTLLAIPHTGSGREMEFPAGYYEFIWNRLDDGQEKIFFLDYRSNPDYWETKAEKDARGVYSAPSGD